MKKPPISQKLLDLYDGYAHGAMTRREFVERVAVVGVIGFTTSAVVDALMPAYAEAKQIDDDDPRIETRSVVYASPNGAGEMGAYIARPAGVDGPLPGVVVIHENRGLNPHIADVARRTALAGYVAMAPDALYPLGGYPGDDDRGRALQRQRDRNEMVEDFIAAVAHLQAEDGCNGTVGCVGFCFGGWVSNVLATRVPSLAAAVPFYGTAPRLEDVPDIRAPLLIHFAGLDKRVNATWPDYDAALTREGKVFTAHFYDGVNHGFHNDTTPRFDADAAALAWQRTLDFFAQRLR
ncbi:MAG: dienelactone hydrolase family protein [Gammaproteobacteria bacterium]|nr:dienelactone hydrolase family protein [Gammaproteobacteria bacterium]